MGKFARGWNQWVQEMNKLKEATTISKREKARNGISSAFKLMVEACAGEFDKEDERAWKRHLKLEQKEIAAKTPAKSPRPKQKK